MAEISSNNTVDTNEEFSKQIKDLNVTLKSALTTCLQAHSKTESDRTFLLNMFKKFDKEGSRANFSKLSNQARTKLKAAISNSIKHGNLESQKLRECLRVVHDLRRLKEEKRPGGTSFRIKGASSGGLSNACVGNSGTIRSSSPGQPTPVSRPADSVSGSNVGRRTPGPTTLRRGALMMLLQKTAAHLPLWLPDDQEGDQQAPPLCGAVPASPNHVCASGDLVAARVKANDGDENWILAEVKRYDETGRYDVEDIDEEQKERYTLSKKRLIALPHWRAHPTLSPDAVLPVNALVWALYPQTTCFYKGVVQRPPLTQIDPYFIAFEDSSFLTGYSPPLAVPQRYVVTLK